MHTEPLKSLNIHHTLADITIAPHASVPANVLKQLICSALDNYREDVIPADRIHREARERHGDYYQTAGYYLKMYRSRKGLTQASLAQTLDIRQSHLSEIENNKRSLGKHLAKKIAALLAMDYRKLL